jgi:hypothetical protein
VRLDLLLVLGLCTLGMALQALPAILEERIDPPLDGALLQVMLSGNVYDRP